MAVPAGPIEARYVGNGVTNSFTIPFLLILPTDLDVFLNGVEQASGYVITGAGNPTSTITFTTAPAVGADVYLVLNVPFERLNDYQENGDFLASTVNRDYDRIWQALKQLYRGAVRALTLGPTDVDGRGWYRAKGNGIRDLADPVAEQDAVNFRFMRTAIEQAVAGVVGGFGWFIQAGVGAIVRTFQDKMRETVSVDDFGAIGSTGLPVYHPLSVRFNTLAEAQAVYPFVTSLTQSIDWAAHQAAVDYLGEKGGIVKGQKQFYVHTDDVLMPDSVKYKALGVGAWDTVFTNRPKTWGGTNIMLYGTGPKNYSRRGITSMSTAGGRRANPGNPDARLSSLMNEDATGATPATPKLLSFGFRGKNRVSRHWGVEDVRIVPWIGADGISEYSNPAFLGLAHDWDGGVCTEDAEFVTLRNVQGVGYFRNYGLLMVNPDFDVFGGQERNRVIGCRWQGLRGVSIRSGDVRKVEALTSSTVAILWDVESFWPTSGVFTGFPASVFQQYSYTGLTRDGANLVFTGVTPDPTIQNLSQLRAPCRSSGAAGTIFKDTFIHGFDHTSGLKAEAFGLGQSTAFEVSGFPLRGIAFDNTKIQSRETGLYYLHDCQDVLMDKCQAEGAGYRVASPFPSNSTAPAASGETRNFRPHSSLGFGPGSMFTPRSIFNDIDQVNGTGLNSGLDFRPPDNTQITFSSRTVGEVMRTTDAGNVGIGVTTVAQKLHVATTDPEIARFERTGSTGLVGIQFKNTLGTASLRLAPSADNAGDFFLSGNGTFRCGTASFPWNGGFTTTAFTITSDKHYKKFIAYADEQAALLRVWGNVRGAVFQMLDAVAIKGDDARIHAGYIAQDVEQAFIAESLDPRRYALFCEDDVFEDVKITERVTRQRVSTVTEPREKVEIVDGVPIQTYIDVEFERGDFELRELKDADGNTVYDDAGHAKMFAVPIMEEVDAEVTVQKLVGKRLSLRYEECLVLEVSYLRSVTDGLDKRIQALEG